MSNANGNSRQRPGRIMPILGALPPKTGAKGRETTPKDDSKQSESAVPRWDQVQLEVPKPQLLPSDQVEQTQEPASAAPSSNTTTKPSETAHASKTPSAASLRPIYEQPASLSPQQAAAEAITPSLPRVLPKITTDKTSTPRNLSNITISLDLTAVKQAGQKLRAGLQPRAEALWRRIRALDRRLQIGLAASVAIILLGGLGYAIAKPNHDPDGGTSQRGNAATKSLSVSSTASKTPASISKVTTSQPSAGTKTPAATLAFTPVVPAGEPQLAKLDLTTHYNASAGSYQFNDLYVGYPITVTEQLIPTSFASPTAAVSTIAATAHATTAFATNYGSAYLKSAATGSSSTVIASTDKLLIFIQTTYQISPANWALYINSLQ